MNGYFVAHEKGDAFELISEISSEEPDSNSEGKQKPRWKKTFQNIQFICCEKALSRNFRNGEVLDNRAARER